MTEPRETKIRRLHMRSMRRGIKEMDLILSAFAAQNLAQMSDQELDHYDAFMSESDLDLYRWISGQEASPAQFETLVRKIADISEGIVRPAG